jgi:hypothetical protein
VEELGSVLQRRKEKISQKVIGCQNLAKKLFPAKSQRGISILIQFLELVIVPQRRKNRKGILIQFPKVSEDTDLGGGTGLFFP